MNGLAELWPTLDGLVMPRNEQNEPADPVLDALALACTPWVLTDVFRALQASGTTIPKRAEAEYAAALHWLVGCALRHGQNWRKMAVKEGRPRPGDEVDVV